MSKKTALLALAFASCLGPIVLSLVSASSFALGPSDLLANAGFELGTKGWTALTGSTFVTVTSPVKSGSWAAALYKGGVTGPIYIYQDVQVVPGTVYTLTGWAYNDQFAFKDICLLLECPGASVYKESMCLYSEYSFYRPITVGPLVPPSACQTVRIKASAEIRIPDPPSPVYFDELNLGWSMKPAGYIPLLVGGRQD